MFPALLIDLFKRAAPYIAVALFLTGVWWHGYHTADKHRIEREAQITAESNQLLAQANQHNADIKAQADTSARIIGETYDKNHQTINDLTAANTALVARLRQQSGASCNLSTLPSTPSTTERSAQSVAGDGGFLEGLVDQARIADEAIETARACQAYVKTLQEVFK